MQYSREIDLPECMFHRTYLMLYACIVCRTNIFLIRDKYFNLPSVNLAK